MKKGKMSKKKKVLLIVLVVVLVVIIGAAAAVYAITHSLYSSSNYTADSDAMKG